MYRLNYGIAAAHPGLNIVLIWMTVVRKVHYAVLKDAFQRVLMPNAHHEELRKIIFT